MESSIVAASSTGACNDASLVMERHPFKAEGLEFSPEIIETTTPRLEDFTSSQTQNALSSEEHTLDWTEEEKDQPAIDEQSLKKRFGWVTIGGTYIPYIIRGIEEGYCAVKTLETKLLTKYLYCLHPNIYSCCVKSYHITEAEAKLFNEIKDSNCLMQFGRVLFTTGDLVITIHDANEFYNYVDVCYYKLMYYGRYAKDKCGFIRVNNMYVVPYIVKNTITYLPLFYFQGAMDGLLLNAVKLTNWDLMYLKFCFRVQRIRSELFDGEMCLGISLADIKRVFPIGTLFEEYWPFLSDSSNLFGLGHTISDFPWFIAPVTPVSDGSVPTYQPATAHINHQPGLSLFHSMDQIDTSTGYQERSDMVSEPPPLQSQGNNVPYPAPVISNNATAMHLMGLSDIGGSMLPLLPNLQYPSHNTISATPNTSADLTVKYQPPLISGNGSDRDGYLAYQSSAEVADLSSPPLSSPDQSQQSAILQPEPGSNDSNCTTKNLFPIMEDDFSLEAEFPFRITMVLIHEKIVPCVNAIPYIYTELLVAIEDFLHIFFPSVKMELCVEVFHDILQVNMFRANSLQMQIIQNSSECDLNQEILLVKASEVDKYMPQLKYMFERPHN